MNYKYIMSCKFTLIKNIIGDICLNILDIDAEIIAKCDVTMPSIKFSDKFEFTSNHAMIISASYKINLQDTANKIINEIQKKSILQDISDIQFTSGFINIKMKKEFWYDVLLESAININYGFYNFGKNEKVNVEYVSANPTGPMHVGHARCAIYGDIVCNLLQKCGYLVTREYYINDAGSQMDKVVDSVLFRANQVLNNDFSENMPQGFYPGEYVIDCAQNLLQECNNRIENIEFNLHGFVINYMLDLIKQDLRKLGVNHDVFISEKKIIDEGEVKKSIDFLSSKGLIYKGILEKPKGKDNNEWEEKEQLLFASSKFGDDMDRPVQKNDGSWAYFAPDIAYHYNKYTRGHSKMILVLGADHKGYKKRISAAVNAMSDGKASIDVKLCELVNFIKDGQPVKMSKRAGNFLTLADVLEEIDPQILRFFLIIKKNDTVVDFDFTKVTEQSKENPIFYIQYAHSRCCSLIKKAKDEGFEMPNESDFEKYIKFITHEKQTEILHKIGQFPRLIKHTCSSAEPHLIATYLLELVGLFHSLWNVSDFKFISKDKNTTYANLIFIKSIKNIIHSSLDCFGVMAMERM